MYISKKSFFISFLLYRFLLLFVLNFTDEMGVFCSFLKKNQIRTKRNLACQKYFSIFVS